MLAACHSPRSGMPFRDDDEMDPDLKWELAGTCGRDGLMGRSMTDEDLE